MRGRKGQVLRQPPMRPLYSTSRFMRLSQRSAACISTRALSAQPSASCFADAIDRGRRAVAAAERGGTGSRAECVSREAREPLASQPNAEPALSNTEHLQPTSELIADIVDDSNTGAAAAPLTLISLRPISQGQPQSQQQPQRVQPLATDELPQNNLLVSPSLLYVKEIGGRPRYLGPTSIGHFVVVHCPVGRPLSFTWWLVCFTEHLIAPPFACNRSPGLRLTCLTSGVFL
jgi:hypothetical protein